MKHSALNQIIFGLFLILRLSLVSLGMVSTSYAQAQTNSPSPAPLPAGHPKMKPRSAHGILPFARHNGELKEGKHMNLELVSQTGQVYLYSQSKTGESVPSQKVSLKATTQALAEEPAVPPPVRDIAHPPPTPPPRPANATPFPKTDLVLQPDTDHYMGSVALRVPYELVIEARPQNQPKTKPETFKFLVHP